MARWVDVQAEAPDLTARALAFFDAHVHKTLATLRSDGSPRISGTETEFSGGDLFIGSMWRAVKALDLRRDPRFALHSGSDDPPAWKGDAKVAGRFEEIADPKREGKAHRFRADITELVVVHLGDPADHIVIESWHEGRGLSRVERT